MSKFIDIVKENGDIKKYSEVYDTDYDLLECEDRNFYIGEPTVKYPKYDIGDIVFVKNYKYKNGNKGSNHLFVIVDSDNYGVPIDYFCMLISSNIDKMKYKKNIKLNKTKLNGLKKDSIVKTDVIYEIKHSKISFCVGKVPINLINEYIESYLDKKEKIYG